MKPLLVLVERCCRIEASSCRIEQRVCASSEGPVALKHILALGSTPGHHKSAKPRRFDARPPDQPPSKCHTNEQSQPEGGEAEKARRPATRPALLGPEEESPTFPREARYVANMSKPLCAKIVFENARVILNKFRIKLSSLRFGKIEKPGS